MAGRSSRRQRERPVEEPTKKDLENLFVFGYACKLYRDDERAMYVDRGKHLIPWMGDNSLLIDRYDGRGHLYDLPKHDVANVSQQLYFQTDSEQAMEAACDEERYLELTVDLQEHALYEEEEWKRYYEAVGESAYKAIGFSYDQPGGIAPGDDQYMAQEEEEDLFVPSSDLSLPEGMEIPRTGKVNAIIEKTAKFIAEHGAQMEIMIKAKQKDNPQFEFMEHHNPLNSYFKHMVQVIKTGRYKPQLAPKPPPPERLDSSFEGDDEEEHSGYLHPSLMTSIPTAPSKPVPKPVVRIHETSYGDLIKSVTKSMKNSSQQKSGSKAHVTPPPFGPPPLPPFMAQDVYGPSSHSKHPPPPGLEPVTLPQPDLLVAFDPSVLFTHDRREESPPHRQIEEVSLGPRIVPPPPDIQPIIDRMALYVAKNGVDFETVVKSKKDTRFDFLHSWHVHYTYYDFRKRLHLEELEQKKSESDEQKQHSNKQDKAGVVFSFKLKSKEQESVTLEKRKAFGNESTDEEDEDGVKKERRHSPRPVQETPGLPPEEKPPLLSPEEIERKQAEDKVKDRLALAAREKLAQASKEKQVQAERKRKAAMFINLLKSGNQVPASQNTDTEKVAAESGDTPGSSRPGTPLDLLLSGKNSPALDIPASPGIASATQCSMDDQLTINNARVRSPLPRAYYGRPVSIRRQPRSPTPPTAYGRTWRSRSRSPRRFGRLSSPPSRWMDRPRSRSPKRFDRGGSPWRGSLSPSRSKRSRSPGVNKKTFRSNRSKSKSPKRSKRSPTHSKSKTGRKKKKHKKSRSRSKSRSPSKTKSSKFKGILKVSSSNSTHTTAEPAPIPTDIDKITTGEVEVASEITPSPVSVPGDPTELQERSEERAKPEVNLATSENVKLPLPKTSPFKPSVSEEKISKVRAMLRASRKAILKEEGLDIDL